MKNRLIAGTAAVAIAAALGMAGTAFAGSNTTVTINPNGDPHGKVKSSNASCVEGRKVKVYRVKPGPDDKIGDDLADSDGDWSIGNPGGGGKIYAKVGKTPDCNGDKSPIVNF